MKGPVSNPPVETQFAQKLSANDKKDRDRAIKKLKKWLGARESAFPEQDMMRIWKGLFYCYWMSDKPLVQEELAENISSMVSSFQTTDNSLVFVTCFAKTFQREWFGIDRWRMDKTMMFVRRFLRHVFKLMAAKSWEEELVKATTDIFRNTVVMSPESDNSSLGFQLHFTDVFLEELAKVGGESLSSSVVMTFIQPWVELVTTSKDKRLREHAEERIFNHLLRQSDPGIEYQMEEDGVGEEEGMELGSDGESDEGEEDESMEGGDEEDGDKKDTVTEEDAEDGAEDPRAGCVDVFIPQMSVEYSKLGEELFKLGSGDKVGHHNREALYRISKKFKDVSDNIFPLGPNLDELDVDIPKINVKKSSAELMKRNKRLKKENELSKKKAKLLEKQKKAAESVAKECSEDQEEEAEDEEEEIDEEEEKTQKRKSGSEDDEEPIEKKPKREAQKKKKQERKRMKREAALKESLEKKENERKNREQLDHDLTVQATLDKKEKTSLSNGASTERIVVGGNKKRKERAVTNGHSEPVKKAKIEVNGESKSAPLLVQANGDEPTPKKKKKKKDKVLAHDSESPEVIVSAEKKKKKLQEAKATEEVNNTVAKENKNEDIVTKLNPKLKKKKLHRIDSDICFNAPSLSKTCLSLDAVQEKPLPTLAAITEVSTPTLPASQKKKKMKKYKAEVSLATASPEIACVAEKLDFGVSNGKVFEESEWDDPLKPGEQEVVLPNKNYKGAAKLEAAKEAQLNPQITPAKSFTATFLKKAVSKSATPKRTKKSLINGASKSECASEPRKKKINFALTHNKSQDFVDHLKAVKSSPQTPHDPSRNPSKTLLKKRTSMESNQKKLNPVGLNTQLNGRSKTMKHLVGGGKRASAMDFF